MVYAFEIDQYYQEINPSVNWQIKEEVEIDERLKREL